MEEVAKQIVIKLTTAGYETYFVGGWVRDKLLGTHLPNDIDIATSATPDQIKSLFEKTLSIGEAFGIIVVICEEYKFEIATFRTDGVYIDGRRPESVKYASAKEDAARRDFTINGLFYDPVSNHVYDYVDGQADLSGRIIRAIGNPYDRFTEDKLRMLRAVRYSVRYGFTLHADTQKAIVDLAPQLTVVSVERIWAELVKMSGPTYGVALAMLCKLGLLAACGISDIQHIPDTTVHTINSLPHDDGIGTNTIIGLMLIDSRVNAEKLCGQLKVSTAILRKAQLFEQFCKACRVGISLYQWTQLYSMSGIDIIIQYAVCAGITFADEHAERQKLLAENIKRMQNKTPLITSEKLISAGIAPGPRMGALLRKAEELSANCGIHDSSKLLEILLVGSGRCLTKNEMA